MMDELKYALTPYVTSRDIKRVRGKLKMTQKEFAELIHSSKPTVERWEMSKEKITGPIVLLLNMLENNMEYVEKIKMPKKEYPLRLYYMHDDRICSIIDVDDRNKLVKVYNYTNQNIFTAFGVNKNPSYSDYEEFLRDRCFPETRDKLKLVLEDLDLPFYDPFMIIKKTEGRMAEDHFWIKIEE